MSPKISTYQTFPTNKNLRFPNQFVAGPSYPDLPSDWQKVEVSPSMRISAHPDLNICSASKGGRQIVLLGFMIDPLRPQASDQEIIEDLVILLDHEAGFYQRCSRCGGRWVLIYSCGSGYRLVVDAAGLRQIFYTVKEHSDELWFASQPRLIADLRGFQIDESAAAFIDSEEFRSYKEFRFPGDRSPYKEIKHLLPNHLLDLSNGRCRRFWPDSPIPRLSADDAAEKVATLLRGLLQGAVERYEIAVSLTAGLDSRVVLAASREICDRISFMTVRQIDKADHYADVVVAGQILSMAGLPHDIVKSSLIVDDDFLSAFKKNTTVPHYIYIADAQAILRRYQRRKVVVTGSASEIGRLSFRAQLGKPETEEITPHDLAKLQKMGKQPYAVSAFADWLQDLGDQHYVPVLDMFEWEQGHGCWLAMTQLEFDIAWRDLFAPFNCREILTTLLGVDAKQRCRPHYTLYRKIIQNMWPELLKVSVNPHDKIPLSVGRMIRSRVPYPIKKFYRRVLKR